MSPRLDTTRRGGTIAGCIVHSDIRMRLMTSKKKKLDELAKLARKINPDRFSMAFNKTDSIRIRVTPVEKEEIKKAAAKYGTTISDYLLQLHRIATQKTPKRKK